MIRPFVLLLCTALLCVLPAGLAGCERDRRPSAPPRLVRMAEAEPAPDEAFDTFTGKAEAAVSEWQKNNGIQFAQNPEQKKGEEAVGENKRGERGEITPPAFGHPLSEGEKTPPAFGHPL